MNGSGTVRDLSIIGCQIELERSCPIKKSSLTEVRIQVRLGLVDYGRWIIGKRMGLLFMNVRLPEADRLAWVIRRDISKM